MANNLPPPELVKAAIRSAYDAAAEHFDAGPLSLWDHFGSRTVEVARIAPGDRVLDVCCGTGASALPAAARVGPEGRVVGVDLAERLLDRARARAVGRGLDNVEFVAGDLTALDLPVGSFDVVVCAFGIFFAPDIDAAMSELRRVVRPGGTLAVTTWGRRLFEPANRMFWEAVCEELPDARPSESHRPIAEPEGLTRLYVDAGLSAPRVERETRVVRVVPDEFWTCVLGSGYRIPIDYMGTEAAVRVRAALARRMAREHVSQVTVDVLYASATVA